MIDLQCFDYKTGDILQIFFQPCQDVLWALMTNGQLNLSNPRSVLGKQASICKIHTKNDLDLREDCKETTNRASLHTYIGFSWP